MFYILDCGMVWELTRTKYKHLLRRIALGLTYSMRDYGKLYGPCKTVEGLSPESAKSILKNMESPQKESA